MLSPTFLNAELFARFQGLCQRFISLEGLVPSSGMMSFSVSVSHHLLRQWKLRRYSHILAYFRRTGDGFWTRLITHVG
jgi:hypothetical protein